MHNIKDLRKNTSSYKKKFKDRNLDFDVEKFKKLDEISNLQGSVPAWLMSHPPTQERINSIKKIHAKIYQR